MEQSSIPILYQDHHLLVVNKPPGLVIHPTYKHADGTMWNALLGYLAQQESENWRPVELPDQPEWARAPAHIQEMLRERQRQRYMKEEGLLPRPCLLHRLDKDTSGVVALARTERACRHYSRQFQQRQVQKRYLAVVSKGAPAWAKSGDFLNVFAIPREQEQAKELQADFSWNTTDDFLLDGALQRDPLDRRRSIVGQYGQAAKTQVKMLVSNQTYILLEARPITGRTHQIRAHLAAAGYAIVGDTTYGLTLEDGRGTEALLRQFLHAESLELQRYPDNLPQKFIAPLPDDLVDWLATYFPEGLETLDARHTVPTG